MKNKKHSLSLSILLVSTMTIFSLFIKSTSKTQLVLTLQNVLDTLVDGIFFGVITMPGTPRQKNTIDTWMAHLRDYQPIHKAVFITKEGKEHKNIEYIHPPDYFDEIIAKSKLKRMNIDMELKRLYGAYHFIYHTNQKYYWSTTDDNIMNYSKLDNLVKELNEECPDSKNQYLFKGHCFHMFDADFLHGGPGMIFSRKAARTFLNAGLDFIESLSEPEDYEFRKLIDMFHLNLSQIASPYCTGRAFELPLSEKEYKNLKKCPEVVPYSNCYGHQLFKIDSLLNFHTANIKALNKAYLELGKAVKKYNDLYYYFYDCHTVVCRK